MTTKHLAAAEAWSTDHRHQRVEIRIIAGTVWVTQEADPVDHVLEAPATFTTDHAGRVALQALTAAEVAVEPAHQISRAA